MGLPDPTQMTSEALLDEYGPVYEEVESLIEKWPTYRHTGRADRHLDNMERNEKRLAALKAEILRRMKSTG